MLDLSFNLLRSVPEGFEFLNSLHTVYFVQNKISKITGIASCTNLRSLEFGGNKIRVGRALIRDLRYSSYPEEFYRKLRTWKPWSTLRSCGLGRIRLLNLRCGISRHVGRQGLLLLSGSANVEKIENPVTAVEQNNKIRGSRRASRAESALPQP